MPWCPKCKTEYQDGFKECVDCGAALVDALSDNNAKPPKAQKEVFLVNVFGPVELSYITSMLEEAGIDYRVTEEGSGNYMNILMGQSFAGQDIWVGQDDFDRAAEIVASYQNAADDDAPEDDNAPDNDTE